MEATLELPEGKLWADEQEGGNYNKNINDLQSTIHYPVPDFDFDA